MERKERERHILTLVYDESEYAEVADSEKPDFLIRHHGEARSFGVEITEFYFYDTDARLRNIQDYVTDIIHHGKFRHKDDTKLLEVVTADVVSAEGKDKGQATVVLHRSPPVEE